jgi:hypothetical protein
MVSKARRDQGNHMTTFAMGVRVIGAVMTAVLLLAAFLFHLRFGNRPDELEIRVLLMIGAFETTIIFFGLARIIDGLADSAAARATEPAPISRLMA